MERIGQCDCDCVQIFLLEKQRVIVIQRNAQLFCDLHIMIAEAGNGNQLNLGIRLCIAGNFGALVQTENCQLNLIHEDPLP